MNTTVRVALACLVAATLSALSALWATGCQDRSVGVAPQHTNTNRNRADSGAPPNCGDARKQPDEECDFHDLGGLTCRALGFYGGVLRCNEDCTLNTRLCDGLEYCGNGILDYEEECDGAQLEGRTCENLGYGGGTLRCRSDCRFDITGCDLSCGDGTCEPDRGETSWNCSQECAFTGVSCGKFHTCGVRADGTAWCWGANKDDQLGVPGPSERHLPVGVPYSGNLVFVSAGGYGGVYNELAGPSHTCAITSDGSVVCWGDNELGQLGAPYGGPEPTLTVVVGDVTVLTAGGRTTCAVQADGAAFCWGYNGNCECAHPVLGAHRYIPYRVRALEGVQTATVGLEHACAALADGSVWCWGSGEGLGVEPEGSCQCDPARVDLPGQAIGLGAGEAHTCALAAGGGVWCWGDNEQGQLGDGTTEPSPLPVPVTGLAYVSALTAGSSHTCALATDQTVWCWGANLWGQLGDGTTANRTAPRPVSGLPAVISVEAGHGHTCAVAHDGTLWCWGLNNHSQLAVDAERGPEHCDDFVPHRACSTLPLPVERDH